MDKAVIWPSCLVVALLFLGPSSGLVAQTDLDSAHAHEVAGAPSASPQGDGPHDFDFLIGKWNVHFRVLLSRLSGSDNWVEYHGTEEFTTLLKSNASFDEFDAYSAQLRMHNKGHSLRLYNTKTRQWSIYQLNNEGMLDAPVIGQFAGNRGDFYGQDTYNDRAIYVRNTWLNVSPKAARWEQSWSADGGKTWEVNWINELSR